MAAINSKVEVDIVLKSNVEKFWENLTNFATTFPKALPHTFQSIEIIEGDGKSAGTVFKATLKPEVKGVVSSAPSKERIDLVDEEKKTICYTFLEGDMLKHYKNFKTTLCVSKGGGDDGCVLKYSAEFEKPNQQIPDPIHYKDFNVKLYQDFDAYLINA